MTFRLFYRKALLWGALLAVLLAGCKNGSTSPAAETISPGGTSTASSPIIPTLTPPLPSPTAEPLAAVVNGMEITLAEYQAELNAYKIAFGKELAPEEEKRVLDDLIDQALLAKAAEIFGFTLDATLLQQRMDTLTLQRGGPQGLADWIAANGYSTETFQRALRRSISAAWMRDYIADGVPEVAEQVHVLQILVYNSADADAVMEKLKAGNDFGNLALQYDPVTGGDLGWCPRGCLLDPALEEAAFSLEPGQFSQVIQTPAGFHILQVLERDPQRPVEPSMLLLLQKKAVQKWLEDQRKNSDIQVFVP